MMSVYLMLGTLCGAMREKGWGVWEKRGRGKGVGRGVV